MRTSFLALKLLLVTVAALAAAYSAIGSVNISGIMSSNFTAADVIRERCPIHLIRPEWVAGKDQDDILLNWPITEIKARLIGLFGLWTVSLAAIVQRFSRRDANGHAA